jgi:uncharacterized protein YraI
MPYKRLPIIILILMLSFALLPVVQASGESFSTFSTGQWFATYYPNENLEGNPVAIQTEPTIGGNWGFGVPVASLPVDHWSARWTQTFTLPEGRYRINIMADDGVRVYLNGSLILNEWHGHIPQTYTVDFLGTNQPQAINVEFFDAVLQAYLTFEMGRVDITQPSPTGVTATILYDRTNGYFEPNSASTVRYLLPAGAVFDVLTVSADRQWVQLRVDGVNVWVQAPFLQLSGIVNPPPPATQTPIPLPPTPVFIPPTQTPQPPPPTASAYSRATVNTGVLNVHEVPDAGSRIINQIRQGESYSVRRGSINGWLQLIINGQLGWVNDDYVILSSTSNIVYLAGDATATVSAARLNVRDRPGFFSQVVTKVNRLESHPIVGRDASNQWLLIDVNGTFGWVSRSLMTVDAPFDLPVVGEVPPVLPPEREYILATATPYNVNMRQGPGTSFADMGTFQRGNDARIVGRTGDNNWWQIEYNGVRAWVSAQYALIQQNADISAIPITG